MKIFSKLTTKHQFPDGTKIALLHRYALQFQEVDGRSVDIGFEQALEPGIDRLIHEESIRMWVGPKGEAYVSLAEREAIVARLKQYCEKKGFTFRVVP